MNFIQVVKLLEADGWVLSSVKGSHYHFKHSVKKGKVQVPFHGRNKEIKPKTLFTILKQAGLK